jgi:hypothetical protein
MADDAQMHIGLERIIAPRLRAGVQVTVGGAALLIVFLPRYGLLSNVVVPRIGWLLTGVAALILASGVAMVIILPAYYRKLSRMMKQTNPEQMRVTLRFEPVRGGNVKILAELRPFDAEPHEPFQAVVPVMKSLDIPPHTPARVYGRPDEGPVVIDTVDGILWPEPDEKQRRLEEAFRVH